MDVGKPCLGITSGQPAIRPTGLTVVTVTFFSPGRLRRGGRETKQGTPNAPRGESMTLPANRSAFEGASALAATRGANSEAIT
jgi:hypothetical protein